MDDLIKPYPNPLNRQGREECKEKNLALFAFFAVNFS